MENVNRHIDDEGQRLVTVVIPLYTLKLSDIELLSLRQCFKVLERHAIYLMRRALDKFSIESHPSMAMQLTGGEQPMATHTFAHHRNRSYWKQYITRL